MAASPELRLLPNSMLAHTVPGIPGRVWAETLSRYRPRDAKPSRLAVPHPWDLMDWSLPNLDLKRVWRTPYNSVGAQRYRGKRGPAAWHLNERPYWTTAEAKAHRAALAAEEAKAARWFGLVKNVKG